jgi:putative ABC transport system substrate-binding protein
MKRREFITLLGGLAAAWPLDARARQGTPPVIGYLSSLSAGDRPNLTEAFRQGLNESGYGEGRNVTIEYRYADNQMDRLRSLAADLIARKVGVIAAIGGNNTALVAKTLTTTIPIVFTSGLDPVRAGLVASLHRPEANVTGISWFTVELAHKHIEVLNELIPRAALIAVLVNPNDPESGFYEKSAQDGPRALGRRLVFLKAGTVSEIDTAFATLAEQRADAVIVGSGPFYPTRARQLAVLAARYAVPLMSAVRDISVAGGLISYGNSVPNAYQRAGNLVGRLLKGAKPADIPIDRATKFELVINLGTARALGISVPPSLLARADEVIE